MKHINIQRIVLNIGLLILLAASVYGIVSVWENRNAAYTQATVISAEPAGNVFLRKADGSEIMYDTLTLEYVVDGITYKGTTHKLPGEYEIGGQLRYCYDKSEPSERFYNDLSGNLMQAAPVGFVGLIVIFLCKDAFKGYISDYLCRYKWCVLFSIITGWIPILYYLWFEYIFEPSGVFGGLSEYFFLLFLLGFVPLVNIVVWTIAAVRYELKMRKKQ